MTTAYVGAGSNLGDRMANLAIAVRELEHLPDTHVESVSHVYRSEAAYVEDQDDFFNLVVSLETSIQADSLLEYLLDIEDRMGREREVPKGPRLIDLDLLLYGDEEWDCETLVLPHPLLTERDFVVHPLLEIAPHIRMPDGSRIHRDQATVGKVIGDEGELPDIADEHAVPIDADDWEVVAQTEWAADAIVGFDASLQFKKAVLEEAGIPLAFDPYEPGVDVDPLGMPITYKIMVPSDYAENARTLLAQAEAAPTDIPLDGE